MDLKSRIFVAGHRGMVGSAIVRKLQSEGYTNLLLKTRQELDLLNQAAVDQFFKQNSIDYVFMAAAKVGGIVANNEFQADFLYQNLAIQNHVIHAAAEHDVKKLLFLGSSCIYPKMAKQPLVEDSLMTGPLEETNEGYAIAKIAGLKLCEKYSQQYGKNFISAMPTNLYGPFDNYHPEYSHAFAALIRKFHMAKQRGEREVSVWGTGAPKREFLLSDDLADALLFLMKNYNDPKTINVGTGEDISIKDLALIMKDLIGFDGEIVFDHSRPDGTPRKLLDVSRIHQLGWRHSTSLKKGIELSYRWAVDQGALK